MKRTLSTSEAADILLRDEYASWSVEAASKLVEYYEEQEQETGEEIEMDAVAIRCDWDEYSTAKDIAEAYSHDFDLEGKDEEEIIKEVEAYLDDNTTWFRLDNGHYLICDF